MDLALFDEPLGASYRLGPVIGRGAAGEVRKVLDTRSQEILAAKILRPEHVQDPQVVERFVRERSVLVGLRDPRIVAVRDLVVEGERIAIVMDLLAGGSLRDQLERTGPLAPALAMAATAEVLDAVAAAHERGVLHRDIKPDNVLLAEDWTRLEAGCVRVADFGIAGILAVRERNSTGLIGTPEYMAPEVITTGNSTAATDVYGAGVLLYELLSARSPFAGPGNDFAVAYRHVQAQVPPLELPDEVWQALARLLDKAPSQRPAAREAAAAFRKLSASHADRPRLRPSTPPEEFAEVERPRTVLRGMAVTEAPGSAVATESDRDAASPAGSAGHAGPAGGAGPAGVAGQPGQDGPDDPPAEPLPDLGTPAGATRLKPLALPEPAPAVEPEPAPTGARRWLRDPRVVVAVIGLVLALVGGVVWLTRDRTPKPPEPAPIPDATATQRDQPTPTGLTVSRTADYSASSGTVRLTITYAAQKAPLRSPFLEVLPPLQDGDVCPAVTWRGVEQGLNLPSVTGVDVACGWSVDDVIIPADSEVQVGVEVQLPLQQADQLQDWLDRAAQQTTDAVMDDQLTGTAYPVQRLQDVQVEVPARTVSQSTVPVNLRPVWPSGVDEVNSLLRSPSTGQPSVLLTAVAGGKQGVRLSDGCSGALKVSADGLLVTALTIAPECRVAARVGNFTDLASQPFPIVARGG